jgi:hypothetical protein
VQITNVSTQSEHHGNDSALMPCPDRQHSEIKRGDGHQDEQKAQAEPQHATPRS